MRVLLVEPSYGRRRASRRASRGGTATSAHSKPNDESLWYPPLGLMKISAFHRRRGDEVHFVRGCGCASVSDTDSAVSADVWDRVYIATLFTYDWHSTMRTIEFYKRAVAGDEDKVFVGGIMASLLADEISTLTRVHVVRGILDSPERICLTGNENIDLLPPDYEILRGMPYATNDTYYAYTTRGCVNKCPWCGVPTIEPEFVPYIDVRPTLTELRNRYGDKRMLKLMDNNVAASRFFGRIVDDLVELGYGRDNLMEGTPPRQRVIDFNQGLDATYLTDDNMKLLARLNIKPMRIAFDRISDNYEYLKALRLAKKHGARTFSNYMLYNYNDSPRDLYERLMINIKLSQRWRNGKSKPTPTIYSYPMRYAPIGRENSVAEAKHREYDNPPPNSTGDFLADATWNRRFTRNIEVMKGAAHGAISSTPSLAKRTIGHTYEEFVANLYMPEELLRNRNKYEKRVYNHEPNRKPGTGDIEDFRSFVMRLLNAQDRRFMYFHNAVSQNRKSAIREYLDTCRDEEIRKWLPFYLK